MRNDLETTIVHLKRMLFVLVLLVATVVPPRAADQAKPKVRAITGFVTIDATSYPAQIEEAVTFLNRVRDAVKAAGYDATGRSSAARCPTR